MQAYPLQDANISQILFRQNEKLIKPINEIYYKDVATLPGIVPVLSETDEMSKIMPAFISQSRLSTYYQNKPFEVLNSSVKYGVEPMGGPVNSSNGSGYLPGTSYVMPTSSGVSAFRHTQ